MAGLLPTLAAMPVGDGPHVIVFGGPNGSGKTSLIEEIKETGLQSVQRVYQVPTRFINPDQVAKDLEGDFASQDARDIAAARAAVQERLAAIQSREAFAFETVMSHPARISEMLYLKEQGYHLVLTFITTDDPEKNVARVTMRFETNTTTGHYVDPEKVRDRYHRTLALLPKAVEIADAAFVYDNSVDFEKAQLQAIVEAQTGLAVTPHASQWLLRSLILPLQTRESDYEVHRLQVGELLDADELRGQYAGMITDVSPNFVVMFDDFSHAHVIHDRLMLDTARVGPPNHYEEGKHLTVQYAVNAAPVTTLV